MMARYIKKTFRHRFFDFLGTAIFVGVLAVTIAWLDRHNATEISAKALVVDGDSLKMNGQKVRLVGIDAPELDQVCQNGSHDFSCGITARDHLRSILKGSEKVDCVGEGEDKYGRLLAECFVGAISLNSTMVSDGWAISYGGFGWAERNARKEKLGLWAGEFDSPSDWRARSGGLTELKSGAILRGFWRQAAAIIAGFGER